MNCGKLRFYKKRIEPRYLLFVSGLSLNYDLKVLIKIKKIFVKE